MSIRVNPRKAHRSNRGNLLKRKNRPLLTVPQLMKLAARKPAETVSVYFMWLFVSVVELGVTSVFWLLHELAYTHVLGFPPSQPARLVVGASLMLLAVGRMVMLVLMSLSVEKIQDK